MGTRIVWRVSILVTLVTLAIVGGYFFHEWRVEKMSRGVLAQAEKAERDGDYGRAATLYSQHLVVMPDDLDVRLKYAESLQKQDPSNKSKLAALEIYDSILKQDASNHGVRRRAAEVAVEIGGGLYEKARAYLSILLDSPKDKDDGHLEYLLGRCQEADNEPALAASSYESAIAHGAPERVDAGYRLAVLLRGPLKRGDDGDKVIAAMVRDEATDYRTHLNSGRYREQFQLPGAEDAFRKAMELEPARQEAYLELAMAAERKSKFDEARQVLDKGLTEAPKAVELYLELANLEQRAGREDRSIDALELGLKTIPDNLTLLAQLALRLANRRETGRLRMQIAELERIGAAPAFTQYLRAFYFFNKDEFAKARQILAPLQPEVAANPQLKSLVNLLLSRVYAELSEPELQRETVMKALIADPENLSVRLRYIQGLIERGDLDEAVQEYRRLEAQHASLIRLPLAALLIQQARRLPPDQRRWDEVARLIAQAAADAPGAVEPALARAQLLMEQGQQAKALDELETARARFPGNPGPWIAQSDLLVRLGRFDEAARVLDGARQKLGDRVDLRLARERLVVVRGGPQVVPALNELAAGIDAFPRDDQRKLLGVLAGDLSRQQDLPGAIRVLTRLVELEHQSLQPQLQLFDLALQSKDRARAETQLAVIDGLDPEFGRYCHARYLTWQASNATDKDAREKFRRDARAMLNELKSRRPDWPKVPLALASLSEQEMGDATLDDAQKREKLLAAIADYRRTIELGLRDPAIVRHVVTLLFRAGRGSEALEIYGQVPSAVQLSGNLSREAVDIALKKGDYRQAEELARKAVATNPADFQARVQLAQVLLQQRQLEPAEAELKKAIDAAKADPERWFTLIRFHILTRQLDKAEKVAADAEASLAGFPLSLAQFCQFVGSAFATTDPDRARPWYARARGWFGKAQAALKDPNDLTVRRRFAEFLLRSGQNAEAEGALKEILGLAGTRSPDVAAWARRSLAQIYALSTPPRVAEALALFAGRKGRSDADADDLRVLALVHEAQRTPEGRRQAVEDLQALLAREAAQPDDRLRLALLLEATDDWTRSREQFRELILRTETARDPGALAQRLNYLVRFADALVRHHRPGDDSDLAEARQLVEKFRTDPLLATILEARIDKAANQVDAAVARLRALAARPDTTPQARLSLAAEAERMNRLDAAEAIYRAIADSPPIDNRFQLAMFLARHGRCPEAIDICETVLADPATRERAIGWAAQLLGDPAIPFDKDQARRVVAWIEKGLAEKPRNLLYLLALGNIHERLGEYPRAEELYRAALKVNDTNGIAANNLAWLIALQGGKPEQSSALREALELINNAIRVEGPAPEYLDTRGMIYLTAGEVTPALQDLEAATRAAPNGPKYFHLARAYLKANDKDKARKTLEDGKTRGLPGGLHPLELAAYKQVASELGIP
jgi:cellulose synthase operon protein C